MLFDVLFAIAILILLWDVVGLANRWYDLKKYGFAISPGVIMWRTKRGVNFIDRVAGISKRGWRAYGTVAAGVGIFAMVFVFVIIVSNFVFLITHPSLRLPGVVLVYPGLIPWLPVVPWIISLASILLVHEFSHGLMLRAQGLQIKSVGGFVVVAVPGAFVEPNEKQLMRASISKRLRMFAAGSMANFILGFLCLAVLLMLLVPKPGVYVYAVSENYAENFTLGSRIYQLDNVPINTIDNYNDFLDNKQPGENVWVVTENENVHVALVKNSENENKGDLPLLSISATSRWNFVNPIYTMAVTAAEILGQPVFHPYIYDSLVPWAVIDIVKWMFILNLGVGLFNMLPVGIFDGGQMMQAILERKTSSEKAKHVVRTLSYFILVLILMSIFSAFLR
jgi:membrane-associated protease RseP (regulator of RpoE activity)